MLYILRWRRDGLDALVDAIDATGYALTFGLHSRIDETIAHVAGRIDAGNVYVNRNVHRCGGGGAALRRLGPVRYRPKAGGPLYLGRLLARPPATGLEGAAAFRIPPEPARRYGEWLRRTGQDAAVRHCAGFLAASVLGARLELPARWASTTSTPYSPRAMWQAWPRLRRGS